MWADPEEIQTGQSTAGHFQNSQKPKPWRLCKKMWADPEEEIQTGHSTPGHFQNSQKPKPLRGSSGVNLEISQKFFYYRFWLGRLLRINFCKKMYMVYIDETPLIGTPFWGCFPLKIDRIISVPKFWSIKEDLYVSNL